MDAQVIEIKAKGNLLLGIANKVIPPTVPVWRKGVVQAVDAMDAAMFPAAFAVDDPESAGLEVKVLFPDGDIEGTYRLSVIFKNITLFSGGVDSVGSADGNEKNTLCFALSSQYRPRGFFKAQGEDIKWLLVKENTRENLELPTITFELYWLYEDSGDVFQRGVPVEALRQFSCDLGWESCPEGGHDGIPDEPGRQEIMARVVEWVFNRVPPQYDIINGSSYYIHVTGAFQFNLAIDMYLSSSNNPVHRCNCYDMAVIVQAFLRLIGIKDIKYAYMRPFGYLKKTRLIGRGLCNNPFYEKSNSDAVVAEDDPARTAFGNHAFCVDTKTGVVLDACAGPHTGTETVAQYLENAIDTNHPTLSAYTPGTVNDIQYGIGIVGINQTIAPKIMPDFPLTKAFMEELAVSVKKFTKRRNKYVVFNWPDPTQCPSIANKPWKLFYSGLTYGQGEVVKTWKIKDEEKIGGIKINVHIFTPCKTCALYRFIELGSSVSTSVLTFKKYEPGLGHYSAYSVGRFNRRYLWVYYNMILDISYHTDDIEPDAVNAWYQKQAESFLKVRIDSDLPLVDDIECDNTTPKVGEIVTAAIKPHVYTRYDFVLYGVGLRLIEETEDKFIFEARRKGTVKLKILAVDENTLLMKSLVFNIKVRE